MAGRMVDSGAKNLNLAGSGLEATGAMAALNVGSFDAVNAKVERHAPGRNFFTYLIDKIGDTNLKASHKQYFLADKLEFLDQADKWFYDKNAITVSVKTLYGKMSLKKDTRQGLNLNQYYYRSIIPVGIVAYAFTDFCGTAFTLLLVEKAVYKVYLRVLEHIEYIKCTCFIFNSR